MTQSRNVMQYLIRIWNILPADEEMGTFIMVFKRELKIKIQWRKRERSNRSKWNVAFRFKLTITRFKGHLDRYMDRKGSVDMGQTLANGRVDGWNG